MVGLLKKGRKFAVINEISSIIVALALILVGGMLASLSWSIPLFEETGTKVVGWAFIVIGFLALVGSIANFFVFIFKK